MSKREYVGMGMVKILIDHEMTLWVFVLLIVEASSKYLLVSLQISQRVHNYTVVQFDILPGALKGSETYFIIVIIDNDASNTGFGLWAAQNTGICTGRTVNECCSLHTILPQ